MSDTTNYNDDYYENDDQTLSLFFLFFMLLLALVLLLGRALHNQPRINSYLSEPAMVLLVSVFVSSLVKIYFAGEDTSNDGQENEDEYDEYYAYNDDDGADSEDTNSIVGSVNRDQLSEFLLTFSEEFLFMVFLPPIIFQSGYQLKRELFFRHLKPIVSFAVVGTGISSIVTGLILWGVVACGWIGDVSANVWELLAFGSLISATDTVSVLGVLNAKQVNPHLFSLVFGESAFNDAVAIVMFQSFSHLVRAGGFSDQDSFVDEATRFVEIFLLDVLMCPLIGMTISIVAALMFKSVDFHGTPVLELSLYILLMYTPFIFAEVMGMSGIITIFVTGMFARRYVEPNVSDETKHNAEVIFSVVAYLAETCIFINLGLSVFGITGNFNWSFICFAFLASLLGRAMSIYPISFMYNFYLMEKIDGYTPPRIDRRPTVDVVTSEDLEENATRATSSPEVMNNSTVIAANKNDPNESRFTAGNVQISTISTITKGTPARHLDKVIPRKFMHFLWFAGLRGAVAYACARDFPDVYGNRNEIIAATTVIVLFSVIVMGAFCDPLLQTLGIRMGVNSDEYMREWRSRRTLNGRFHRFEKRYLYNVLVRSASADDDVEMVETGFQLTEANCSVRQAHSSERQAQSNERATTGLTIARTLTGSSPFFS
mmetsp:Transcript_24961/g.58570  ORF Transcript_24961/g.58570 Transcript_24961/m.58570 type:complete len:657 (-) Transcript_24961:114-2084(-)